MKRIRTAISLEVYKVSVSTLLGINGKFIVSVLKDYGLLTAIRNPKRKYFVGFGDIIKDVWVYTEGNYLYLEIHGNEPIKMHLSMGLEEAIGKAVDMFAEWHGDDWVVTHVNVNY